MHCYARMRLEPFLHGFCLMCRQIIDDEFGRLALRYRGDHRAENVKELGIRVSRRRHPAGRELHCGVQQQRAMPDDSKRWRSARPSFRGSMGSVRSNDCMAVFSWTLKTAVHAVSQVVGYMKGKPATYFARLYRRLKQNLVGKHSGRAYCVLTVRRDDELFRRHIR